MIQKIIDLELLKNFNNKNNINTFTQSYEYLAFLQEKGVQAELVGEVKNNQLISSCVYSIYSAKRGKVLEVIHGPVVLDSNPNTHKQYLTILKNIATQNKCDFIRINPICKKAIEHEKLFRDNKFLSTAFENMFSRTNILNLKDKSLKTLENKFSSSLNSNLKKLLELEKANIIKIVIDKKLDDECKNILEKSNTEEQSFDSINKTTNYYGNLNKGFVIKLYYKDQLAGFQTYVINNKYICNHHGSSMILKNDLKLDQLIHYKAILQTIELGLETFDFWGVSDPDNKRHPWFVASNLVREFGGEDCIYLAGQDLALTPKYWLTNLYEKCQKLKRGH